MPGTARWLIAFVLTLAAMVGSFLAVYNVTVWLMGPAHHDASDMNIGLAGVFFGALAALIGAIGMRYVAAYWLGHPTTRRRRSRQ